MMHGAYLSLGSNIGDRLGHLRRAVNALSLLPSCSVERVSGVYETKPVGFAAQDDFYNIAVMLNTEMSARCLLGACLGIEAAMGRVRNFKNGPRVIDIDLLLCGGEVHSDAELTLPHPEMYRRAFVLIPLAEILPGTDLKNLSEEEKSGVIRTDKSIF